jgi:shikimate dehydrogenase
MSKLTYGLVGHPVRHSFSPAMHNAAFKELGIDAEYILYDIEPADLGGFLDGIHSKKIAGLNVTIPHKIAAKEHLERYGTLDEFARKLGAVNTIRASGEEKLRGFNTDGPGFYRSLVEDLKFEPEGKNIFVLGAGGAASAIVMYLGLGPKKILIYDVVADKTGALIERYKKFYGSSKIATVNDAEMGDAVSSSELVVNATPIGMHRGDPSPVDKKFLRPGLYIYDLIYNRPETTLVKDAVIRKCRAVTGLGMLLYQGAFEIWTGKKAPVAVMRRALKGAIRLAQS